MPLLRAEFQRYRHLLRPPLLHDPSQVLYLPFDKDDGSYARDRSGYNNHGTIYGATRVAGKIGSALSFDGSNDYLECPTFNLINYTMMAWFYRIVDSGLTESLIGKSNVGSHDIRLEIRTTDILRVGHYAADATFQYLESLSTIPTGVWRHIAGVFALGDRFYLYINGILDKSGVTSGSASKEPRTSTKKWWIARIQATYAFNGIIDEVRIYNRVVAAAEIQRVMNMRGLA